MKDNNTCPKGQQECYITVLAPGTKVVTRSLTGRLFKRVGFVRRAAALKDGVIVYCLEDDTGCWLADVTTDKWEIKPAPEPKWVVINGYGAHAVIRRGTTLEGRIVFAKKDDTSRREQTGGNKFCTVFVMDTEAAAEKMAALLNELEAE